MFVHKHVNKKLIKLKKQSEMSDIRFKLWIYLVNISKNRKDFAKYGKNTHQTTFLGAITYQKNLCRNPLKFQNSNFKNYQHKYS